MDKRGRGRPHYSRPGGRRYISAITIFRGHGTRRSSTYRTMVLAMATIEIDLDQLGKELVNCSDGCADIVCNQRKGILPRCMILERPNAKGRGCLAVGLNPGPSKAFERTFYIKHGISYRTVKEYWHENNSKIPYYSKSRRIIDAIGLTGPIIWSDLAKCENKLSLKNQPPRLQTLRHCYHRFLRHELELMRDKWPVLGFGWEAYRALAYLVPKRAVIGIPHPTGSHGHFTALFEPNNGPMKGNIREMATKAILSPEPMAVWLSGKKRGD